MLWVNTELDNDQQRKLRELMRWTRCRFRGEIMRRALDAFHGMESRKRKTAQRSRAQRKSKAA